MAQTALSRSKITTKNPQLARGGPANRTPATARRRRPAQRAAIVTGDVREGTRGEGRVVVEVAGGITVYPARGAGDRWRAVWYENGRRRQCQSATEDGLAARIEKVTARLAADAPGLELPGAELIGYYLSPGRHPAAAPWSRKHADTQARLCRKYVAPVIGGLACEDIKTAAYAGRRERRADRAGRRPAAAVHLRPGHSRASPAATWPTRGSRKCTGRPATGPHLSLPRASPGKPPCSSTRPRSPRPPMSPGSARPWPSLREEYELMACFAAYTGLRWGELAALTIGQIDTTARTVTVDRKVIEIGGTLYVEAPKGRKQRRTIYPTRTPEGYPLADMIAARIEAAQAAQHEPAPAPSG